MRAKDPSHKKMNKLFQNILQNSFLFLFLFLARPVAYRNSYGLNLSHSCDLHHHYSNAKSLSHCSRTGMEPTPPQRQLSIPNLLRHHGSNFELFVFCFLGFFFLTRTPYLYSLLLYNPIFQPISVLSFPSFIHGKKL